MEQIPTQPLQTQQSPPTSSTSTPTPFPPPAPIMKPMLDTTGRSGGFRIFVIFSLIIIVIVYGAVAYLYYKNRLMKQGNEDNEQIGSQQVTPTPEFTPDQIKIENGSVVREKPGSEVQILINKEDYESTGITGFAKVTVSPDNSKLCFESLPPAPEPALYVANVDGTEVTEVSPNRQRCLWASDSGKIYYINTAATTSPINIYSYSLTSKAEKNLTSGSIPQGIVRRFSIVGLSGDSSKLICSFEDVGVESSKQCEINLSSDEVTLL